MLTKIKASIPYLLTITVVFGALIGLMSVGKPFSNLDTLIIVDYIQSPK